MTNKSFLFRGELLQEKISDKIFEEILEINITASSDNDKVRSNVMRMIGNLLRLFNKDYLTKSNWSNSCLKLIETLISNALNCNDFKVKWNACHAIGNFMKNPSMFDDSFRNKWQVNMNGRNEMVMTKNGISIIINLIVYHRLLCTRHYVISYPIYQILKLG